MHASLFVASVVVASTSVSLQDIQVVAQVGHADNIKTATIRADGRYVSKDYALNSLDQERARFSASASNSLALDADFALWR